MKITKLFKDFFHSESIGGIFLFGVTLIALVCSNSANSALYFALVETKIGGHSLVFWVNDVLMTFFFLLVGLEIERELYVGELSNLRSALLPIVAAIGGMLVPISLYVIFNFNSPYWPGFGIPMATDIAFLLGILSLLGSRVPYPLKIFLTALAIIDDIGSIVVIALFYSNEILWPALGLASAAFGLMVLFNHLKYKQLWPYFILAAFLWYGLYKAGIHPTITGVLMAFCIPFSNGERKSPSFSLQKKLHYPVALFIMPMFAFINSGVSMGWMDLSNMRNSISAGIMAGLVLGKPLGVFLFSYIAIYVNIADLPTGVSYKKIFGASILTGIGFTMSLFIAVLAFNDPESIKIAKISILFASLLAALAGILFLLGQGRKD